MSINNFVHIIDVYIEIIKPKNNISAKPLIGPLPTKNKIIVIIIVVKLVSIITSEAWLNPKLMLFCKENPKHIHSLIFSKIKILESMAMPKARTIPAIPDNVNVALIIEIVDKRNNKFKNKTILAIIPKKL